MSALTNLRARPSALRLGPNHPTATGTLKAHGAAFEVMRRALYLPEEIT
jgi:hypothetical protein